MYDKNLALSLIKTGQSHSVQSAVLTFLSL